jgi:hypothetical protein
MVEQMLMVLVGIMVSQPMLLIVERDSGARERFVEPKLLEWLQSAQCRGIAAGMGCSWSAALEAFPLSVLVSYRFPASAPRRSSTITGTLAATLAELFLTQVLHLLLYGQFRARPLPCQSTTRPRIKKFSRR